MPRFNRTILFSFAILVIALLAFGGISEAGQESPPLNIEAVRQVLKQYSPAALTEYIVVRKDKLVSFQSSALAKPDSSVFKTEDAKRMGMGLLIADGFYCLAFGKNAEAAKYYEAYYRLSRELPLRDLANIDMKPSPAMEAFFKDPTKMSDADLNKLDQEWNRKVIANLEILAASTDGIHFAVDLFYAMEIESIYLVAQSVIQSDGKSEGAIAALAGEENNIKFVEKLMAAVHTDPSQRIVFEISEKKAFLTPIVNLLKKKAGKLSKADAKEVLKMVAPERKKIATGILVEKKAK